MKIKIEEHNPGWSSQFEQIKDDLKTILGKLNPKIEHIGSTSVPNLAAKPVIDIAIGIESTDDLDKTIEPMISNHYIYYEIYNSVMPLRRLFVGLKDKKDHVKFKTTYSENDAIPHDEICDHRLAHVHIWEFGTTEWVRHIAFRDYLCEYPKVKSQYEDIKKQLSLRNWKDGNEYNDCKNDFIKSKESKAILWYDEQIKQQLTKNKLH